MVGHYIILCLVFVIDFSIFSANHDYECLPSSISGFCTPRQNVRGFAHEDKHTKHNNSQSCAVNETTMELVWDNSNRTVPNTVGASQAPTEISTAETDAMHPPTTEIVTQTQHHTQKRTTVNLQFQFASSTFPLKRNSSEQNYGAAHSASNKTFQGREQQRSTESTDQPKISKNLPIYIAVPVAVMLILVVALVILIIKKRWSTKTIYIRRELPALPEAQNTSREATQTHIYEEVRDETSRSGHEYSTIDDETYETVPPSSSHIVTDEVELSNRNHLRSQNPTNREDKIVYVYNATSDP